MLCAAEGGWIEACPRLDCTGGLQLPAVSCACERWGCSLGLRHLQIIVSGARPSEELQEKRFPNKIPAGAGLGSGRYSAVLGLPGPHLLGLNSFLETKVYRDDGFGLFVK